MKTRFKELQFWIVGYCLAILGFGTLASMAQERIPIVACSGIAVSALICLIMTLYCAITGNDLFE